MNPQETTVQQGITIESARAEVNDFIHRVYGWMGIGLIVTSIVAYVVANTPELIMFFVGNRFVFLRASYY